MTKQYLLNYAATGSSDDEMATWDGGNVTVQFQVGEFDEDGVPVGGIQGDGTEWFGLGTIALAEVKDPASTLFMYLGGDGDFWTWDFDIERYQPTWRNQTLAMGLLTTLQTGVVGVDVPSYLQYFMGGANSIRGYEYEELGSVLFGKNQLILTLEYQFTVLPIRALPIWNWAIPAGLEIAIFSDTGTAWSSDDEFTRDRFKTGIGAGLSILIPAVDVARVDIAVGEDGKVVFHFGIWPKMVAQRFRVR